MKRKPQLNLNIIDKIFDYKKNFLRIISSMAEGIVVHDVSGEIIFCNSAAEKILGLKEKQLMGKTSFDTGWKSIHEDGSEFLGEDHPAMVTIKTGEPLSNILMGVHKPNGELTWISINSIPVCNDGETGPYAVIATFHDITNFTKAEKELYESHILMDAIVDSTSDLIWSVDPQQFGLLSFNNALKKYFWESRNLNIQIGFTPFDLLPGEYPYIWIEMYKRALASGQYSTEYVVHTKKRILELSFNVLKRDNIIFAVSVFGKDITRRKEAEEKLNKESDRRLSIGEFSQTLTMLISQFQNILDIAACTATRLIGDGSFIKLITEDGKFLQPAAFNHSQPKIASLLQNIFTSSGVPLGERISGQVALEGKPVLIPVVDQEKISDSLLPENRPYLNQIGIYSLMIVPLYTRGKMIGTFGLCRTNPDRPYTLEDLEYLQEIADIVAEAIHRSRSHSELISSEERYRSLVENLNEMVIEIDISGSILYISPNVKNILGYDQYERLGNSIFEFVHPNDLPEIMKKAEEGWRIGKTIAVARLKHRNGEWRRLECAASSYTAGGGSRRGIIIIRDITQHTMQKSDSV